MAAGAPSIRTIGFFFCLRLVATQKTRPCYMGNSLLTVADGVQRVPEQVRLRPLLRRQLDALAHVKSNLLPCTTLCHPTVIFPPGITCRMFQSFQARETSVTVSWNPLCPIVSLPFSTTSTPSASNRLQALVLQVILCFHPAAVPRDPCLSVGQTWLPGHSGPRDAVTRPRVRRAHLRGTASRPRQTS